MHRRGVEFAMLLSVRARRSPSRIGLIAAVALAVGFIVFGAGLRAKPQAPGAPQGPSQAPGSSAPNPAKPPVTSPPAVPAFRPPPSVGLNVVVLDPAHGGIDLGARGTEGIHESDVVLQFAAQVRQALEQQGFQVLQTREGNQNPSFDDRSARVNAQRGAVFITLHIASTGLPGTVRTYVMPEMVMPRDPSGLIPWDQAQAPFVVLSHKLGDLVQAELAKRFKGSPELALVAPVRQLRTTAAPAIAVEVSSVSVQDQNDLDRMIPGVAEGLAHGVAAFRPSYVVPSMPGSPQGNQP
jgi:N-acetylmuramoyl-L-alanine amidase